MNERYLPHSIEAERSVLGALLIDNTTYAGVASLLRARDFFRDAHRKIYLAMQGLLERPGGACDFVTLREQLTTRGDLEDVGGPAYVAGLVDGVPRSSNVAHYARIVHEKALARAVIATAAKITAAAYEHDRPVREVLAEADAALLDLRQGYREGQVTSLAASTGALMADLEFRVAHRGQLTGIDTGFAGINELTFGWQPGDLIIFAARPSMGKTALLLNTLVAGLSTARPDGAPRTGLCFSMEMTEQQLQLRLLSSLSGIPATRLAGGYLGPSGSDDWALLNVALERMHGLQLFIDDRSGRTVADIRAECRRLHGEHGLDLVVVDYVQLTHSVLERRGATRTEELSDTSRKLKTLAKELRVPIIVVSQLRRISGRPKMDDLRECGSLEQDADQVCMLHRKNHKDGGTTEFILEKNRNGPTGTALLTFVKECVRFDDGGPPPEPDDPVAEAKAAQAQARKRRYARRAAGVD